MPLRILAALALAIGLSSAAQAQTVQVVTDCAGVSANPGPSGRLYTNQSGGLCLGGAAGAPAGTLTTTPSDADAAINTYSLSAAGTTAGVRTRGYGSVVADVGGSFVATVVVEFSTDSTDCVSDGTWYTPVGALPGDNGASPPGTTLNATTRRREYRGTDGHCARLNVLSYTSGTISATLARRTAPIGERGVYIGGGLINSTLSAAGTSRSATVNTTAANVMAANANRRGFWLKNDTATDVWCNFDGTATAAAGSGNFKIAQSAYFASEPGFVSTNALSCIVASGSAALTAREH